SVLLLRRSGVPRPLPPFPTRRSSDLLKPGPPWRAAPGWRAGFLFFACPSWQAKEKKPSLSTLIPGHAYHVRCQSEEATGHLPAEYRKADRDQRVRRVQPLGQGTVRDGSRDRRDVVTDLPDTL